MKLFWFLLLVSLLGSAQAQANSSAVALVAKPKPASTVGGKPASKGQIKPAARAEVPTLAGLTPEQLAVADQVVIGKIPCELGVFVTLDRDAHAPGRFILQTGRQKHSMTPALTSTGAVRLEDAGSGAVWLQLSNKSMLMNQKLGQRVADDCMNPDQVRVAQALLKVPAPHLLDAPVSGNIERPLGVSGTAGALVSATN
jgi:hypothetical protein